MTDTALPARVAPAEDADLIEGIHNYCDRRCARCRFAERCLTYLESRRGLEAAAGDPTASVATVVGRTLYRALEMMRSLGSQPGVDLALTPEELNAATREHERHVAAATNDPLVLLARDYALAAWPIVRVLRRIVASRGDAAVMDAVETIEALCGTVASKTFRAVSSASTRESREDVLQNDANGSAKIARLLIDESRRAWRVLMESGRATANGVPAQLVGRLDQLDAGLAARFPSAMQFIRPGFDTE